jgi:hypothetical protein
MNQTKTNNRIVVITGTASTTKKTVCRNAPRQRSTTSRIVIIKQGVVAPNPAHAVVVSGLRINDPRQHKA